MRAEFTTTPGSVVSIAEKRSKANAWMSSGTAAWNALRDFVLLVLVVADHQVERLQLAGGDLRERARRVVSGPAHQNASRTALTTVLAKSIGETLQRVRVLAEEGPRVGRRLAGRDLVLFLEGLGRVLVEHLVVDDVAELDLHHDRDLVARGLLLAVERGRADRDAGDVALQHGVGAGVVGHDLVAAAPDELEADARGQRLLDVEHRRGVGEERHADGLDVRRQRRAAAGERSSRSR